MFCSIQINAQQDSQYTQYMYNTITVNPAYAGSRGVFSTIGLYRAQWVGLNGAPKTMNFSLNTPIGKKGVGIGLSFFNDEIGPSKEQNANIDFSYTIKTSETTKLSFGLKGGLNILNIDFDELNFDPSDSNSQNINNQISPNIGAGVYLHNDKWYIGLSTPNFLNTKHYDEVVSTSITEEMHVYLIGGYVFDFSNNVKFKPAILAKSVNGAPLAIDASVNFKFYDKFTLGAAYRWDAALSALAGFQISDQLMIGYAYDFETTELGDYNSGSHEIFLRFELFSNVKKVINPRFF